MSDRNEPPIHPEYDPYEGLTDLTGNEPLPPLEDPTLPPATPPRSPLLTGLILGLLLVVLSICLSLAACGDPSTLVDVDPYTDGIRPVLPPGDHWVDFSNSGSSFLGRETSRDLVCLACAGDPAVTGFRMQLFRMEPDGPRLVAHTNEIPATGPVTLEYDIREEPLQTEFLLRVTFHRSDGTIETCEKTTRIKQ